jgi:hypothetical protein
MAPKKNLRALRATYRESRGRENVIFFTWMVPVRLSSQRWHAMALRARGTAAGGGVRI